MKKITREDIQDKFSGIEFIEEGHQYIRNGLQYLSATTFIHQFTPYYDAEGKAAQKAYYTGLTTEEVLEAWEFLNLNSTYVGTPFHEHNENFYNHIIDGNPREYGYDNDRSLEFERLFNMTYENQRVINNLEILKKEIPRQDRMDILKSHFLKFHQDSKDNLVPIATEIRVYLDDALISGTLDQLFWSNKTRKYHVFDWKTNKRFRKDDDFYNYLLPPLDKYPQTEFWEYAHQLSLYRYILSLNFPEIEFGDNFVVWFYEKNLSYELKKLPYLKDNIIKILGIRKNQI